MDLEDKADRAEEEGDLETACLIRKEIAAHNRDSTSFFSYARLAQQLGRWGEAEAAFAEALRIDPMFSLGMEGTGILWYDRTDKDRTESLHTAVDWYLKATQVDRNARVLTLLGCAYGELGDRTKAKQAFEDALQMDPRYEEAMCNLAEMHREENPKRAAELLEKAIDIDPNYAVAHQKLGIIRHKSGDLIEAEYHFRRSVEADPIDHFSHLYLANCLAVQGRTAEAEQTYRFVTSLHPEDTDALVLFANFLESVGKHDEALAIRVRAENPNADDQKTEVD